MSERTAVKLTYRPLPVAPVPKTLGTAAPKSIDDVTDALQKKFGPDSVKATEKAHKGDPFVVVDGTKIVEILRFLRDDERFYCTNLHMVGAVDYPIVKAAEGAGASALVVPAFAAAALPNGHIAVVYVVYSYAHRFQLTLKVLVDRDNPSVASVSDVYRCANWYERECFDMLGVKFENHPHHARILLPPDWVGHPLRRDYEFPEEYNGMKVPL